MHIYMYIKGEREREIERETTRAKSPQNYTLGTRVSPPFRSSPLFQRQPEGPNTLPWAHFSVLFYPLQTRRLDPAKKGLPPRT